ncbi:MAG: choice-of-anchor J domain-containing protein, partial [Rhodanobacteraceae bacterium]
MNTFYKATAFAIVAAIGCVIVTPVVAADPPVSRGADYVSPPSIPQQFYLDARTRPIVPTWQPGDPIHEVPRQFHGEENLQRNPPRPVNPVTGGIDILAELQREFGNAADYRNFETPLVNVQGQGFSGVFPPDPSGDVGGGYFVQSINGGGGATYEIYNTDDGSVAAGPFNLDGLGSGGACASGFGDGVVLYDQLANRWLLTEFSGSGNNLCVYISADDNPVTTTWTRYDFTTPGFPDYPKYGVWPDAYYVGANQGPAVYALDRQQMLVAAPATLQRKSVPRLNGLGFQMVPPVSVFGSTPPPVGSPGIYLRDNDDERNNPGSNDPNHDFLELFTLHVDFTTPANTVLTGPIQIQEDEFDSEFNVPSGFGAIHQPGTSQLLDPLLEVPMIPLGYRNFGDHESIVGNHVTQVQTGNIAGIRWFELRRNSPGDPWTLYQQGTYSPDDPNGITSRWMGALGMDSAGNIALGYSVARVSSGHDVYPGLRYVGRLASDPLGVMTSAETSLIEGGSSQTNFDRWGDYHQVGVDPADGCTFWFTGMYEPPGGQWSTRIGSFKFDACGTPTFTLTGTNLSQSVCAAPSANLDPVSITVGSVSGFSDPVDMSFGDGLPTGFAGSYTVNPVTPPGTTEADLNVTGAVAPGPNMVTLRATAGATIRDLLLDVDVATEIPPAPALQLPANGATNVSTQPTFVWGDSDQAGSYLIEIATDAAFANVILSQTVTGATTFQPTAALPTNTQIYWRVSAINTCGNNGPSTVFSFITQAAPGQCSIGTTPTAVFSDDVENGTNGWTHSATVGNDTWTISGARPNSPSNSWYAQDPAAVTDQQLTSPTVSLPTNLDGLTFQFQHWRNMGGSPVDTCYDGGILEVSLDGGTFQQVPGTLLETDPYNGTIASSFSNPLAGMQAWCGQQNYTNSVVDISTYAGHDAQFRFRLGSDSLISNEGWYIDDINVQGCSNGPDQIFANGFEGGGGGGMLSENFDDISTLPGDGWILQNNSDGIGTTDWFQSDGSVFNAQDGSPTGFIGANFNNTDGGATGGDGTISNWLVTPLLTFNVGSSVAFYTRSTIASDGVTVYPDRIEVRLCTGSPCSNVGSSATDTGDFGTLLQSVNPNLGTDDDPLGVTGYPLSDWALFSLDSASGVPTSGQGRIAFRYFVTSAGPTGVNSNYIGIDTVDIQATPA